jgi:GNAT superfamily N-acetyltransferase
MDRDRVLEIQRRALRDFAALMGSASPGARLFEREGVSAAAIPVCPERSIANSVAYADRGALIGALGELASFYDELGIAAWTVWVPDFDTEAIVELEAAGHTFDGKPVAMVLELKSWDGAAPADLDWDDRASGAVLGEINDAAYGFGSGEGFGRALAAPPERFRLYRARVEGETACVLGTLEHGAVDGGGVDLGFYFVATLPEYRGRGLTTRLMSAVIADARERGFATCSLQASAMGEPVYARLGFQPWFRLHLYERRRPGSGAGH